MTRLVFALTIGALAGLLAATQPLADTDMWWHLATGRETLAHGFVRTDVFSWTVSGAPISTDQWLGQVVMWLSYAWLGWHGVAALRVALAALLMTLVALSASRSGARPLAALVASVPALLLTRAVTVDRPELMGLVLFAALLPLLRRARERATSRDALAIVVLMAAWTNVHGSFALGVVLIVVVCAEAALREPALRARLTILAIAALAVTLANPAGLGAWTAPGSHLLSPPREIQEWSVVDVRTPLGVAYVATLALLIASAFIGPRVPAREVALLVPIVLLSLTAARQTPLLAIAAAPLFAERLELLLDRLRLARAKGSRVPAPLAAVVPALLAAIALVVAPTAPDERAYPVAARASIPLGDAVLARYEWGGWLIWSGVPVFVDGRLTPFSGAVLDDYRRVVAAAPGWRDTIARRGVRLLLVSANDPVAIRAAELGWRAQFRSTDGNDVIAIAVP